MRSSIWRCEGWKTRFSWQHIRWGRWIYEATYWQKQNNALPGMGGGCSASFTLPSCVDMGPASGGGRGEAETLQAVAMCWCLVCSGELLWNSESMRGEIAKIKEGWTKKTADWGWRRNGAVMTYGVAGMWHTAKTWWKAITKPWFLLQLILPEASEYFFFFSEIMTQGSFKNVQDFYICSKDKQEDDWFNQDWEYMRSPAIDPCLPPAAGGLVMLV